MSRVLLLSVRSIRKTLFNSALYEFEDLVAQFDEAVICTPVRYHGDRRFDAARQANRALRAARSRTGRTSHTARDGHRAIPFPVDVVPDGEFDLLFATFDNPWDLDLVELVAGFRDRCRHVVAYMPEVWPQTFESRLFRHENFAPYDRFFVGTWHDVARFEEVSGVPTESFAPAVDVLRFAPLQERPPRSIDVTNIGRRSAVTHAALLEWAKSGPFYFYDDIANGQFPEAVAHRDWLADVYRRTRYVIANHARCDRLDLTRGVREMGYRHPEGAASGTVMLGDPPDTPQAKEHLDWPDAVVPLPVDAPDIVEAIAELDRDPDRVAAIRAGNIAGACRRLDWLHRWEQVLGSVGLDTTPGMDRRRDALARVADTAAELVS